MTTFFIRFYKESEFDAFRRWVRSTIRESRVDNHGSDGSSITARVIVAADSAAVVKEYARQQFNGIVL